MKSVHAYWWSPARSARLAVSEVRANGPLWARLAKASSRTLVNFGDELSALVIQEVSGRDVRWVPPAAADVLGIGSIIELYGYHGRGALVWGTGLKGTFAAGTEGAVRDSLGAVLAVRGPRTRAALGVPLSTPVGDPGVFAPRLVSPKRASRRESVVVLPHFRTYGDRAGRAVLNQCQKHGWKVVEPTQKPLAVIEAIRDADVVVTSSLHGLIVSHAMATPVLLANFFPGPSGELAFKYHDYLESVDVAMEWHSVADLLRMPNLHGVIDQLRATSDEISENAALLAAGLDSALGVLK